MDLIRTQDVVKVAGLGKFGGRYAANIIMQAFQLNKINRIYSKHYTKPGIAFIDAIIDDCQMKYDLPQVDLAKIPKEGPFIIVANHPFGAIEGMLLVKHITAIRPDFKIIGNFLFNHIQPIQEYVLGVNPFETHKASYSSIGGLRRALSHVRAGHPLAIFPAGEVSTNYNGSKEIIDREWELGAIRFVKECKVPVVPVYFHGQNSATFHLLGKIHPMLRTARIPSEVFNKQNQNIKIRIGKPISVNEQLAITDALAYGHWLRAKTYALEAGIETDTFKDKFARLLPKEKPETIGHAKEQDILATEIVNITPEHLLYQWQNFSIYCAPTSKIPHISDELGRLREITFREVGEGTNQSTDTDHFDRYYHQLFIWDGEAQKIVGGYRIGKGKDIISAYGVEGFYISTLFRINDKLSPMLKESIELGRSFIVKEYQRKPMSLFLLWKGILYFLLKNEEYRYLIGPVSISNSYSALSKQIMVEWIKKNYPAPNIEAYVAPRKPFVSNAGKVDTSLLVYHAKDTASLDQLIKEIEPSGAKMPVLFKKYLSLGGKIACFNIDPAFNNSLDGLLLLDLYDVPRGIIQSLTKDLYADVFPDDSVPEMVME